MRKKDLKGFECPIEEAHCPDCEELTDDDLQRIVCASEQAMLVTSDATSKGPRMVPPRQSLKVTQNLASGIEILIKPFEAQENCLLPFKEGNCKSPYESFYYDSASKECKQGCNRNANSFESEDDCSANCKKTNYCNADSLEIKKAMTNGVGTKPPQNKFNYTIPEGCVCNYLKQKSGYAYIAYNISSMGIPQESSQLTNDYFIIPLKDGQQDLNLNCQSIETSTNFNEMISEPLVVTRNKDSESGDDDDFFDQTKDDEVEDNEVNNNAVDNSLDKTKDDDKFSETTDKFDDNDDDTFSKNDDDYDDTFSKNDDNVDKTGDNMNESINQDYNQNEDENKRNENDDKTTEKEGFWS